MTDVPSSSPWIVWPLPDDVRDLIAAFVPEVTPGLWYCESIPAYALRLCGEVNGKLLILSNIFWTLHMRFSHDHLRAVAVDMCQTWKDYLKTGKK